MESSGIRSEIVDEIDAEFLKSVLDGIKDSIKIVDRSFNIVYTNQAGLDIIGKPLEMSIGENHKCFEEFYKSARQCSFCVMEQVRKSGLPAFHTFRTGEGEDALVKEISLFPLLGSDGQIEYYIEIVRDITALKNEMIKHEEFANIISDDPSMSEVFELMESVAPTDSTVLINGETGVGKELVARAIHRASKRVDKKFVAINCGALTESLLETELFGHEKGAFTGAEVRRIGKFELADKGTLFLDEIGDITSAMQVKILRALQEGEITRVGGNDTIRVNIRVICATNIDLEQAVADGSFREDLYYRINVIPINIPPLRERQKDIELLANHYLQKFNRATGKSIARFSPSVITEMKRFYWPGNVRELRNIVERSVILTKGSVVEKIDLPRALRATGASGSLDQKTLKDVAVEAEKVYLLESLKQNRGNINKTAQMAGVNTRTIHRKMQEFGLKKEPFKE